jgi:gamma-glutamylcyclotransferase (GGCT)/AIG2-like uncharacterized protein YtfP
MSRGFATIVPDPASTVWGILWDLTDEDVARLDRYEGVAQGSYHKETVSVIDTTGVVTEALVYIARETDPGVPKADYIGRTLKGARAGGFPDVYVTELESWRA